MYFKASFLICHQALSLGNWGFLLHNQADIVLLNVIKTKNSFNSIFKKCQSNSQCGGDFR